jgi:hypothetical protein
MHGVTLHLSDGRVFSCPPVVTGTYLTTLLDKPSLTLGSATPLNSGQVLRGFRFVGSDDKAYDLTRYQDVFLASREWFDHITT